MGRRRIGGNFAWRFDDAYWFERTNDKTVFKEIKRLVERKELSADKAIRRLFASDLWRPRLRGKTAASWKRCYYRWRKRCAKPTTPNLVTECKRKMMRPRPDFAASSPPSESFIGKRRDDTRVRKARVSAAALLPRPDAGRTMEKHTMQKLSTAPFSEAKKRERKVTKGKGKETRPGCFSIPLRPRACVRGRYAEAGAAADELIALLGGSPTRDRGTWAYYCYHHDIENILDKARELKSHYRQGELRNPVTAFQRWLIRNYGKEAK